MGRWVAGQMGWWSHAACAACRHKLEPVVTLHHFVHPLWFDALGGFTTDAGIPHFVSFATFAVRCAARSAAPGRAVARR